MVKVNMLSGDPRQPSFEIQLSKSAKRYYDRLKQNVQKRIDKAFEQLTIDPLAGGDIKPIKGEVNTFRVRVGDWRVIYEIDWQLKVVRVHIIAPRGQAYK